MMQPSQTKISFNSQGIEKESEICSQLNNKCSYNTAYMSTHCDSKDNNIESHKPSAHEVVSQTTTSLGELLNHDSEHYLQSKLTEQQHSEADAEQEGEAQDQTMLEMQSTAIINRFQYIHQKLIQHSHRESLLHEKWKGYRPFPIQPHKLTKDFSNKLLIISGIDQIIDSLQQSLLQNQLKAEYVSHYQGIIENRFQEYYLERHYGNKNENSIQKVSLEDSSSDRNLSEGKKYLKSVIVKEHHCESISQIGGYVSIMNEHEHISIMNEQEQEHVSIMNEHEQVMSEQDEHEIHSELVLGQNENELDVQDEGCQTSSLHFQQQYIYVPILKIIEVEVGVEVTSEMKYMRMNDHTQFLNTRTKYEEDQNIFHEESQVCSNIEDIIEKYSKTYQMHYQHTSTAQGNIAPQPTLPTHPHSDTTQHQHPYTTQHPYSEHLDHDHHLSTQSKLQFSEERHPPTIVKCEQSEIELSYSDFPDETNSNTFKLPLDSYAQIESLISDRSNISKQRSNPTTKRQNLPSKRSNNSPEQIELNQQQILHLNERQVLNKSLYQRIQENQKILHQENTELKDIIQHLNQQIYALDCHKKESTKQIDRLTFRLEDQIQQNQYYVTKFQELDLQILEEKVQCLTYLNQSQQQKIDQLGKEIQQKNKQLTSMHHEINAYKQQIRHFEQLVGQKNEEMKNFENKIYESEREIKEINANEEQMYEMVTNNSEELRREIDKLYEQNLSLKGVIEGYKNKQKEEGLNIKYEEAEEIKQIIQGNQHFYAQELNSINNKYGNIISLYQEEIQLLKAQINQVRSTCLHTQSSNLIAQDHQSTSRIKDLSYQEQKHILQNSILRNSHQFITHPSFQSQPNQAEATPQLKPKTISKEHLNEFQEIIEEYDQELASKDEEILELQKKLYHEKYNNESNDHIRAIFDDCIQKIEALEMKLTLEQEYKKEITKKIDHLDHLIKRQIQKQKQVKQFEKDHALIEELSKELQTYFQENEGLRNKVKHLTKSLIEIEKTTNLKECMSFEWMSKQNEKLLRVNKKLKKYSEVLELQIKSLNCLSECEQHKEYSMKIQKERDYFYWMVLEERHENKEVMNENELERRIIIPTVIEKHHEIKIQSNVVAINQIVVKNSQSYANSLTLEDVIHIPDLNIQLKQVLALKIIDLAMATLHSHRQINRFRPLNINICNFSVRNCEEMFLKMKDHADAQKDEETLIYCSPEVLLGFSESEHSLVWTIGLIIDELFHQKFYYNKFQQILAHENNYVFFNQNTKIGTILQQMIVKNKKQRIDLRTVKEQVLKVVP